MGAAWTFIVGSMQFNLGNAGTVVCKGFYALFLFLLLVNDGFQIFLPCCTEFFFLRFSTFNDFCSCEADYLLRNGGGRQILCPIQGFKCNVKFDRILFLSPSPHPCLESQYGPQFTLYPFAMRPKYLKPCVHVRRPEAFPLQFVVTFLFRREREKKPFWN